MGYNQKGLPIFIVMLLLALKTSAVPATGRLQGVFTTDKGECLTVCLRGDEHLSYWKSDDGRCFRLNGL